MKHNIYLVGMGPGKEEMMTGEALKALEAADVIIGLYQIVRRAVCR